MQIRRGTTRTVLLLGKYAIKLPRLSAHHSGLRGRMWSLARGILANISESEWSGMQGVCPVLWSGFGGIVNIMPRCKPVYEDRSVEEYYAISNQLFASDKKPQNLGLLNGELVWIDYDQDWNDQPPCCIKGAKNEEKAGSN